MSSNLEVLQQQPSKISTDKTVKINHTCILKSKENIFKPKRDKVLKKKLKKYRLRRDGKEDDDIIDVSKILVTSLKIKSPNSQEVTKQNSNTSPDKRLPKNYLFKMVRKKKESSKPLDKNNINKLELIESNLQMSPLLPETESKQTNAFKLLMDSRNKSIGSNSPGKERVTDTNSEIEHCKKKELKAKRNLALQQMAQKKGCVKNQENEDYIDECIKRKLDKRADRLKKMITSKSPIIDSKMEKKKSVTKNAPIINNELEEKKTVIQHGKLKLFNFLSDDENSIQSQDSVIDITPEDDEFLKKLAPSIRKKENMLSYFKKVTKDETEPNIEMDINNENVNSIIKVKFRSKPKKKKLSNSKVDSLNISQTKPNEDQCNELQSSEITTPTRKRKRDKVISHIHIEEEQKEEDVNSNGRPKRNVKKPLKYSNDILSSSSDEELHIFTPRKKKAVVNNAIIKDKNKVNKDTSGIETNSEIKDKKNDVTIKKNECQPKTTKNDLKSKKTCNNIENNKAVKMAPIFSTKSKLTPLQQEARQNFLMSGVPDKLKIKSKDCDNVGSWNHFYTTVHIQQKENALIEHTESETVDWTATADTDIENESINYDDTQIFGKLLSLPSDENTKLKLITIKHKPEQLLNFIKKSYSKFPVYRTFHLLKKKSKAENTDCTFSEIDNSVEIVKDVLDMNNDFPDKLNWNDKYKPISSKQIIGNFESVKELKKWLECWSENQIKNKNNFNSDSDLSDFCFSDSDTNSRDALKHTNNVLIISGKSGTGKTSCVYAVAAELAIKVIEVNASSKRTGKIMLQDLQEATQSHKVNRGNNKKDSQITGSQSSQEKFISSKIVKKHGRPKKTYEKRSKRVEIVESEILSQQSQTSSQESRTEMSLILIDDADIVFDQDDGFCSAVSQLIHYSKRPVILITSSLTCPHLQKYIAFGKTIKMNPLIPRMLGTWLDIMSLADTNSCYPGFGRKLLDYFRGDIRKTIHFLQFYMTSSKHMNQIDDASQDIESYKSNIDDENSSMSWAEQDTPDDNGTKEVDDNEIKTIVERQCKSLDSYTFDNFNIWWNTTNQLSSGCSNSSNSSTNDISLTESSIMLDTLSYIDYLDCNVKSNTYNITSKPWLSYESSSVMEKENMDCYNKMDEINEEICKDLAVRSVSRLKNCEGSLLRPPTTTEERKRNKIVHQHNTLSKYLNPSNSLDRRALALDYWSTCRTICRHEKNKTDNNLKRNNRFCHYLKSLNILCKNDYFDDLCESLT